MATNNVFNNLTNIDGTYIPLISGNWYKCGSPLYYNNLFTVGNIATGNLYFKPFFVPVTSSFTDIACYVGTGAAGNVNMGIYASDVSNSQPTGSPITNSTSGSQSTASTGVVSYTFSGAITLSPGIYWLALTTSATISYVIASAPTNLHEAQAGFGEATLASSDNGVISWAQIFVYNATLPAIGSLSPQLNTNAPSNVMIWLKAQ